MSNQQINVDINEVVGKLASQLGQLHVTIAAKDVVIQDLQKELSILKESKE